MRTHALRGWILDRLGQASGAWISGEALCVEMGVTRAAISKQVGILRQEGFQIEARTGLGYRLLGIGAQDAYAALPLGLNTRFLGKRGLVYRGRTTSTQDLARRAAREGASHGTVVLAGEQTAPVARSGAIWEAPPGSLALSLVLRPEWGVYEVSRAPVLLGLALKRALSGLGVEVGLRWPCDLWGKGGKVAGILVELEARSLERVAFLVAGVGVRMEVLTPLRRGGEAPDAFGVLRRFLEGLELLLDQERSGAYPELLEAWVRDLGVVGTWRTLRLPGGRSVSGWVEALDDWGRLGLRLADGELLWVSAGDPLGPEVEDPCPDPGKGDEKRTG